MARNRKLRVESLEDRRMLAITVDTLVDELDGSITDGDISLRDAIAAAPPGETIDFATALRQGNGATIHLTLGELVVDKDLTIIGPAANELMISAVEGDATRFDVDGGGSRIFRIDDGTAAQINVAVSGLTLSGGDVLGDGGAILNREDLTLTGVSIEESAATGSGGGVAHVDGRLTIDSSTLWGNTAGNDGGGVATFAGFVSIRSSTISGNTAGVVGGGVVNVGGTATIEFATISDNQAMSSIGGGVASRGDLVTETNVRSTIIAGNQASDVSIFAGGTNSFDSNGFNMIGVGNGISAFNVNDMTGAADPRLAPLSFNGGPTMTHAPLADSPVINAGMPSPSPEVPLVDQRGLPFLRIRDGRIDIGAYEVPSTVVVTSQLDVSDPADGVWTLRELVEGANAFGEPVNIVFDSTLDGQTIQLQQGQMTVTDHLSIDATSLPNGVTIIAHDPTPGNANGDGSRIFNVDSRASAPITFAIRGLTLTGGDTTAEGGAVLAAEDMALFDVRFVGNSTTQRGGALSFVGKRLSAHNVFVADNRSATDGGGIFVDVGSTSGAPGIPIVDLVNSTVVGNQTGSFGAGVYLLIEDGVGRVRQVSLLQNSANGTNPSGGGIFIRGENSTLSTGARVTMTSSVVRGNVTSGNIASGGGIEIVGRGAAVVNSLIEDNHALGTTEGGGGIAVFSGPAHLVRVSIVDNSTTGSSANGGGVFHSGANSAQLFESEIARNYATGSGGGASGRLLVEDSVFADNQADVLGGGIHAPTHATIIRSTLRGNIAAEGGGIASRGPNPGVTLSITDSTISDNSARLGGGVSQRMGSMTILQSTISGNLANTNSGGVYLFSADPGSFQMRHSTITANSAGTFGGGLTIVGATLLVSHTILAGNSAPLADDLATIVGSANLTYSLIGTNDGTTLVETLIAPDANGNLIGGTVGGVFDPRLGPLADNGGPTFTHALLSGSPAIDAGDPTFVQPPIYDQRGEPFERVRDGDAAEDVVIDMGAFEVQAYVPPIPGDFDGDGDVDGRDFLAWQRNPSAGNLGQWQDNYGSSQLSVVSSSLLSTEESELDSRFREGQALRGNDESASSLGGSFAVSRAREDASDMETAYEDRYVEQVDRVMESFAPVPRFGEREFGEMVARRTVRSATSILTEHAPEVTR